MFVAHVCFYLKRLRCFSKSNGCFDGGSTSNDTKEETGSFKNVTLYDGMVEKEDQRLLLETRKKKDQGGVPWATLQHIGFS